MPDCKDFGRENHVRSALRVTLRQLLAWTDSQIETLYPGCFALVMATGIVSNAVFLEGSRALSDLMFAVNASAFSGLAIFTVLRACRFPRMLWRDLTNPRLVFSFLTVVTGSDVLGEGPYLRGFIVSTLYLWLFALTVWILLTYFSFVVFAFLNTARGADIAGGGWLLAIVGAQSLVVLGASVASSTQGFGSTVFVIIHILWGVGLGLYAIYIAPFAYRMFFLEVAPDDITPVLWVVMGAAAITTNAGSALTLTDSHMPFLRTMLPFIDGATFMMWAWAGMWIPLLVLLGIWKHGVRRVPITYTPLLWSLVFPLGMYSVASLKLSLAGNLLLVRALAHAMLWIALATWAATSGALVVASWRSFSEFARSVP